MENEPKEGPDLLPSFQVLATALCARQTPPSSACTHDVGQNHAYTAQHVLLSMP